MEEQHQHLAKPIIGGGGLQPLNNTHSPEEEEPMHRKRDLSCYYGLRQNPKKTTHKSFELGSSSEPRKKILFRCGECGKGFRYEKCLSNHQAGVHLSTIQRVCEESIKSLCSGFSRVRKKKRSRVVRYRRKTSFTTFLEPSSVFDDGDGDEELEVAECLILLSKSSPKIVVDGGGKLVGEAMEAVPERLNGFLSYKKVRNEQKVLEEGDSNKIDQQKQRRACGFDSGIRRFLGHKDEFHQWKLPTRSCDFESGFYRAELGAGAGAMECSVSDDEIVTESGGKGDDVHQCKLCNKIFSSYQALGGHMTSHRMIKSKSKKSCREESIDRDCEDDESVKKEKKMHRKLFKEGSCFRFQSKCQGRFRL
ncbi:C2H2-type zinc finger family protein [Raphanus sativus]|uniref:Uncharacterized protein LOC108846619 n=1 Tax=Raphanus sativus TaxID=3726 RepID=A0A6J0MUR6_RAPSA|nr:uncharacterized protein LOC108846619 [Raphanus sativus]KAJ4908342.1 C2H2-type zinc finger family protein [Raphanus sativus]